MGVDFVTNCTPTFTKGWANGRDSVQSADLFTDMPTETTRTSRVAAEDGATVQTGESVLLRSTGSEVVVVLGRTKVGVIRNPPSSLANRIAREGGGIATGTVSKVHKRSGDFDVRVN